MTVHCAVIQTRFETVDPATLRDVLVTFGGATRTDAGQTARRARGILGERFTPDQARAVVAELTRHDYGVQVVPAESLPKLSAPRLVRWCEFTDQEFRVPDGYRGDVAAVTWSCVFVVSAGQIAELKTETTPHFPARTTVSQHTHAVHYEPAVYRKESRYVHIVDVIGVDLEDRFHHVRLPAHELAYRRILGDRPPGRSFERFLEVVETLVVRSTNAVISPATRKLLVERNDQSRTVPGALGHMVEERTVRQYNRWLLMLVTLNEQRDRAD